MDIDLIELRRVQDAILDKTDTLLIITERPVLPSPESTGLEGPIFARLADLV